MVYQRKQKSKCQRKNGKSIKDGLELRNFQKKSKSTAKKRNQMQIIVSIWFLFYIYEV